MNACIYAFYLDLKDEAERMVRSVKHFYPDMPIELFNKEQCQEALREINQTYLGHMYSHFAVKILDKYDLVIHLDGDTVMCDTIPEILAGDYEVAGSRDVNDSGKSGMDYGHKFPGNPNVEYLNVGVFSIHSKAFALDWNARNIDHLNTTPFYDNGTFNEAFYSGKYKTKLLDPRLSACYYNLASVDGTKTHWDSWKNIKLVNDKLILNNKTIRVLHRGGGAATGHFDFDQMFQPDVAARLHRICNG